MFESESRREPDNKRAMGLLKTLQRVHKDIVWPQVQRKKITFQRVRDILIKKFGSNAYLDIQKDLFLQIYIQDNENLEDFANRYLVTAQRLIGAGSLSSKSCRTTMAYAVRPLPDFSSIMTHTLAIKTLLI